MINIEKQEVFSHLNSLLASCPFCGGKPDIHVHHKNNFVECCGCMAKGPTNKNNSLTPIEAITAWNYCEDPRNIDYNSVIFKNKLKNTQFLLLSKQLGDTND